MIRIGIGHRDYNSKRSFEGAVSPNISFVREPYIPFRRLSRVVPGLNIFEDAVTCFIPTGRCDLYHTFNTIVLNGKPWIVSFESVLPRIWNSASIQHRLLSILVRNQCKTILALSKNARLHIQLRNQSYSDLEKVLAKVRVVYPGIEDYPECYAHHKIRTMNEPLHLVFIGNDFFRKGGHIAVSVFERLKSEFSLRMTVVSTLSEENYVLPTPPGSSKKWMTRMHQAGVGLVRGLTFTEVRYLLAQADVLLLPTLDDSFGYSVLEAMATGVVPIATKIRALPEIIEHGHNGLLLDVNVSPEGRLIVNDNVVPEIEDHLVFALRSLLGDRTRLASMGEAARKTYEQKFNMSRLTRDLEQIYEQALA